MTYAQRFDITVTNNSVYAPLSWGCPAMLFVTDYSIFKKQRKKNGKSIISKKN